MTHTPKSTAKSGGGRLPSLDGWRGVAILLVTVGHMNYAAGCPKELEEWLRVFDASFGVRLFFTISGFIITWLMLKEHQLILGDRRLGNRKARTRW